MSFDARFPGICGSCGDHIDPGDEVTYEESALVHVECADGNRRRRTAGTTKTAVKRLAVAKIRVCSLCHQEIPLALGHCENCACF